MMNDSDKSEISDQHDGDCTIYASLVNNEPSDGICTCGFGLDMIRKSSGDHMYSKERLESRSPSDSVRKLVDALEEIAHSTAEHTLEGFLRCKGLAEAALTAYRKEMEK